MPLEYPRAVPQDDAIDLVAVVGRRHLTTREAPVSVEEALFRDREDKGRARVLPRTVASGRSLDHGPDHLPTLLRKKDSVSKLRPRRLPPVQVTPPPIVDLGSEVKRWDLRVRKLRATKAALEAEYDSLFREKGEIEREDEVIDDAQKSELSSIANEQELTDVERLNLQVLQSYEFVSKAKAEVCQIISDARLEKNVSAVAIQKRRNRAMSGELINTWSRACLVRKKYLKYQQAKDSILQRCAQPLVIAYLHFVERMQHLEGALSRHTIHRTMRFLDVSLATWRKNAAFRRRFMSKVRLEATERGRHRDIRFMRTIMHTWLKFCRSPNSVKQKGLRRSQEVADARDRLILKNHCTQNAFITLAVPPRLLELEVHRQRIATVRRRRKSFYFKLIFFRALHRVLIQAARQQLDAARRHASRSLKQKCLFAWTEYSWPRIFGSLKKVGASSHRIQHLKLRYNQRLVARFARKLGVTHCLIPAFRAWLRLTRARLEAKALAKRRHRQMRLAAIHLWRYELDRARRLRLGTIRCWQWRIRALLSRPLQYWSKYTRLQQRLRYCRDRVLLVRARSRRRALGIKVLRAWRHVSDPESMYSTKQALLRHIAELKARCRRIDALVETSAERGRLLAAQLVAERAQIQSHRANRTAEELERAELRLAHQALDHQLQIIQAQIETAAVVHPRKARAILRSALMPSTDTGEDKEENKISEKKEDAQSNQHGDDDDSVDSSEVHSQDSTSTKNNKFTNNAEAAPSIFEVLGLEPPPDHSDLIAHHPVQETATVEKIDSPKTEERKLEALPFSSDSFLHRLVYQEDPLPLPESSSSRFDSQIESIEEEVIPLADHESRFIVCTYDALFTQYANNYLARQRALAYRTDWILQQPATDFRSFRQLGSLALYERPAGCGRARPPSDYDPWVKPTSQDQENFDAKLKKDCIDTLLLLDFLVAGDESLLPKHLRHKWELHKAQVSIQLDLTPSSGYSILQEHLSGSGSEEKSLFLLSEDYSHLRPPTMRGHTLLPTWGEFSRALKIPGYHQCHYAQS